MSTRQDHGPGRTRRDEVEDILGLVPGATTAETDALLSLFADLDGPAHAGELPGEAAAVAAFRTARRPAPVARRGRVLASLTTLLTFKTAAVALAATSVGGVALAAGTGTLPTPLTPHKHHAPEVTVEQPTTTVVPTPTAAVLRDAAKAAAALDREDAKTGKDRTASFGGLCTAFAAGNWDNARAAGNPAFARLVAAAPAGDVTDFCSALDAEATAPAGATPHRPAPAGKPGRNDKAAGHAQQGKSTSAKTTHQKKPAPSKAKAGNAKSGNAKAEKATAENAKPHAPGKPDRLG